MGSGGTWARGWKRDQLKVIRWTNCIRPREAPELNLDGGWDSSGGQGVLLALFLLCPSPPMARVGEARASGALA